MTLPALRDLSKIIRYLYVEAGAAVARRAEDQLLLTMETLVELTALGRRPGELVIHGVLHGARDIAAIGSKADLTCDCL